MRYLTLTLRSGHRLFLNPNALLGFYPDSSGGSCIITASPYNIVVDEAPEQIMNMLEPGEHFSDDDIDLLK